MDKGLNLGIAKTIVSNKITNEFLNESEIKSKGLINKLVETIKKSPILIKEYSVFNSIENKHTDNDIIASKFIDSNLIKFSCYSIDEIKEAHKLLEDVVSIEDIEIIPESKLKLYNSIGMLIIESNNPDGDVNKMHQAYESVLNYIKENVNDSEEESTLELNENLNIDDVVVLATEKYNETFSSLDESEVELVKTLVFGSETDKKKLFEDLKSNNIKSLESIESNGVADKINEAIDKLNKMVYSQDSLAKNIVELKNLKENLN